MELHNNRVGDFYKRIKSQQSDSTKKIPFRREIQFSKKKRRNKTMKNESNQCQFFLENRILLQAGIFLAGSDCCDLILFQKSPALFFMKFHLDNKFGRYSML